MTWAEVLPAATGPGRVEEVEPRTGGAGFPTAAGPAPEHSPSVGPGPGDGFTVGYRRFVPEHPLATQRAFVRRVAPK